jgi:hypothetical protein
MTSVKKETSIYPSSSEMGNFALLLSSDTAKLVLTSCIFEGKPRFAVALLEKVDGEMVAQPLAIILNGNDSLMMLLESGEVLPAPGPFKTVLN